MSAYLLLLQQGVGLPALLPASVSSVLCEQLGIDEEYLRDCVNTIFLDGKPVDHAETASVRAGSVLALSASLPGFVGAAMRKGGYYARMRSSISYSEEATSEPALPGGFVLKLFNRTCGDLGPLLLDAGVIVKAGDLGGFFGDRSPRFWSGFRAARLNGVDLDPDGLTHVQWSELPGPVLLTVTG
jgi:hypothetical protein